MNQASQKGVALVITLVMLAIVTVMAILFLGISRREQASVKVAEDMVSAQFMADSAYTRALAMWQSRLLASSNRFDYDFQVSTNLINTNGFASGDNGLLNINYFYGNGSPLSQNDLLQNLNNLYYDPRPPVFIPTNDPATSQFPSNDFRFYLDLNRNRRYDPNGWQRVVNQMNQPMNDANGAPLVEFGKGDPEWIGVLENPNARHSGTNRFVGRYAFVLVPSGKTLDLNFIHNRTKNPNGPLVTGGAPVDGFRRNHGLASWELNLAAFFRELNTNVWGYNYQILGNFRSSGSGFDNATLALHHRYENNYNSLLSPFQLYGNRAVNAFQNDGLDEYADGRFPLNLALPDDRYVYMDDDNATFPWAGSDNPSAFADVQDLFSIDNPQAPDAYKLLRANVNAATNLNLGASTYDRSMFYRLMAQLGTDSSPAWKGKINLNYSNVPPYSVTNYLEWSDPRQFFLAAADRLVRSEYAFGATNIPVFPTNFYSARLHRLLQVAANIYDATTNRHPALPVEFPDHYPTVFRPVFGVVNNSVAITNWAEVNDVSDALSPTAAGGGGLPFVLLSSNSIPNLVPHVIAQGLPFVVGAKKGYPNFNEFELRTSIQVGRKLEVVRRDTLSTPFRTNQMYIMGISNLFGIEAWNSYSNDYPRNLEMRVTNRFHVGLTNYAGVLTNRTYTFGVVTNFNANDWEGNQFQVPLSDSFDFIPTSKLRLYPNPAFPVLEPDILNRPPRFEPIQPFPSGLWLEVTNELTYILIDRDAPGAPNGRIVDYVNLTNIVSRMDVSAELIGNINRNTGEPPAISQMWDTNSVPNSPILQNGLINQMQASLGNIQMSASDWTSFNLQTDAGATKQKSIDQFRVLYGLNPIFDTSPGARDRLENNIRFKLNYQVPFTPVRKLVQTTKWQANDPLVHYTMEDLLDRRFTNTVQIVSPPQTMPRDSNLGLVNERYQPWRGNPAKTEVQGDYRLQDPLIYSSDDWNFPTNKFPNIGWLGRVHRGTPWQTIYFKSGVFDEDFYNSWAIWSGHGGTHPTNDWKFADMFTVAPNENAATGLLGVNQDGQAAWAAVLSGIPLLKNSLSNGDVAGAAKSTVPEFESVMTKPSSTGLPSALLDVNPELGLIVESINETRKVFPGQRYPTLGSVLAAPALTVDSPYLNLDEAQRQYAIPDDVYEQIPMKMLSLLKADEARATIYAFGQSLEPAVDSIISTPGPFFQICTNYQITGEVATKTVVRFEGPLTNLTEVIERYEVFSPE